jgi:hypothetical protein
MRHFAGNQTPKVSSKKTISKWDVNFDWILKLKKIFPPTVTSFYYIQKAIHVDKTSF